MAIVIFIHTACFDWKYLNFFSTGICRNPYGCGEQNMIASAPNVYTHMYLESVGKMRNDTPAYQKSIERIRQGKHWNCNFCSHFLCLRF